MKEEGPEVLAGKFYFSEKQRGVMDAQGRPHLFAHILGKGVMQYTELIDVDMLLENPGLGPLQEDAVYLGEGFFHHREA